MDITVIAEYKDVWILVMMASSIAFLFRQYIKKEERLNKNAENYMSRMEKASQKYEGVTEKMLEYQAEDTKAKIELAKAMKQQADATSALGTVVNSGLNDLSSKLDDARNQIVAHIDIKDKKRESK